jgi:dienelactone hydrolase
VRTEPATARRSCGDLARLDLAPDLAAWAVAEGSAQPLLAEHHPDTVYWRDLAVDPGLVGVKPGRGRVADLRIGCRARPDLWPVPVTGVLGDLVWHPRLPLVAGLTVPARHARPWIADYRTRTVTVYERIRAATSLSELGPRRRAPLAWCGDRLLLLTPATPGQGPMSADPAPSAPRSGSAPPQVPSPLVFEAAGPGHVEFEPGLGVLATLAAARVAALDPADDVAVALTGPLLVRELSVPDDGGLPLVECAAGEPDRSGLRWSARRLDPATGQLRTASAQAGASVRVAGGRATVDQDGEAVRLVVNGRVHRLALPAGVARLGRPAPPRTACPRSSDVPARLVLDCVSSDGRVGLAVVDVRRLGVTVAWTPESDGGRALSVWAADRGGTAELVVHRVGGVRHYLLRGERLEPVTTVLPDVRATTVRPAPVRHLRVGVGTLSLATATGVRTHVRTDDGTDDDLRGPMALWLQTDDDTVHGRPGAVPRALAATGHACSVLRLPLRWPADAPAEALRDQVIDAVEGALRALDEHASGRFNGRVVIGGHSFGATLALVALAAIPRLAGAMAHSGCYNRTLTPTGFQFERRPYWAAPAVYEAFSALLFADRLDRPVLIVHGTDDTNRATPPEQAVELYRGIVATGGRARLVLLPCEGHTFVHAETHRHLAEVQRDWLDQWRDPGTPR